MTKLIEIQPCNRDVKIIAESLWILNEFQLKFHSRKDFVEKVIAKNPSYNTAIGAKKLELFWSSRTKDEQLNEDLKQILNQL